MPVRTLKSRSLPMPVALSAGEDFDIAEPAMPVPVTSSVLCGLCHDIAWDQIAHDRAGCSLTRGHHDQHEIRALYVGGRRRARA